MPFDGQCWAGGMGEPPGRAATLAIGTFFQGNMLGQGLESSSASRERGRVRKESTRCMGRGIYVCLLMGNIGWEAWVSPSR